MSNRLPETDLANWSFLSRAQKRLALENFERPKLIKGSYEPFRKVFPDAINQQFPLFVEQLKRSEWEAVDQRLIQECRGNEQLLKMNRQILFATHAYAERHSIQAAVLDIRPLRFFGSVDYFFGLNLLIRYPDRAKIIFLDMRKSHNLKENGQTFVSSAIHHRFREAYPDLMDAEIEVWRYKADKARTLIALPVTDPIISWDDLVADVRETHEIWEEAKRGDDGRRRAVVGIGPLFD